MIIKKRSGTETEEPDEPLMILIFFVILFGFADDLKVKYPPMAFGGQIVYARTRSEVEKASSELISILQSRKEGREQIPLGFDIEWRPNFNKGLENYWA